MKDDNRLDELIDLMIEAFGVFRKKYNESWADDPDSLWIYKTQEAFLNFADALESLKETDDEQRLG